MDFGILLVFLMAVAGTFAGISVSFSHSHEFPRHGLLGGGGFNPYGGYYQSNYWGKRK
ncbi:FIP (Fungus-Induced Protein) Related [Caenorhabditis elegans]|uniref:FIP (Fungus-Induced Protein) Related n=1 Tax=Caenorhabditis elegans TaxID=6239 RepID=Q9U3E7_CAEEL|nr:FIP (Fungus-Induced Protein) Related [Caenorhabditis elegans]CAB54255.1 FIP (Fungus-Induced Protein) Related [Caenorhabditis elegans]|eukprot:NP_492406.1 FIP (Fungus-Induced Protein) Related [Caenorhabditis elegans]